MSEHTEIPPLDPVAFVAALIMAPLLVTMATFWVLYIPVVALVLGGPVYLIVGTPVLLTLAFKAPLTPAVCTKAALGSVAVLTALAMTAGLILENQAVGYGPLLIFAGFSALFAAIWAATFASLYTCFSRNPVI